LWCEKQMPIQADFIVRLLAGMAQSDPGLRDRQPWKAAHKRDQIGGRGLFAHLPPSIPQAARNPTTGHRGLQITSAGRRFILAAPGEKNRADEKK